MSRRLLLAAALLVSTRAYADDDALDPRTQKMADTLKPDARAHFLLGYRSFNEKDYKTASIEFEIAYKIDPEVPLLFTWAQSERLGGNCPHALELYQKYLYSDINRDQADYARHWIDACGGVVATKVAPKPIVVDTAPPRYVWYTDKPADALAGGGIIALVVGGVYFIKAKTASNNSASAMYLDDHEQFREDTIHDRNVGITFSVIGGVLGAASLAWYIYDAGKHDAQISTDGRSVALSLKF
jgi:tetratricopeptide (TPR) repeat protein